jgi:hypothetical protein
VAGDEELSYRVTYTEALREVRAELAGLKAEQGEMHRELRTALTDTKDLKARVRGLELRFYGILAGLMTAVGILVYNGRTP